MSVLRDQDIAIHIDSVDLGNNKKCFICENVFHGRSNLSRHLRKVHYGLAPHKNIRESYHLSNCNSYIGITGRLPIAFLPAAKPAGLCFANFMSNKKVLE